MIFRALRHHPSIIPSTAPLSSISKISHSAISKFLYPSGSQRLCEAFVCQPHLLPAYSPHGALLRVSRCLELSFSSFYTLFTLFSITVDFASCSCSSFGVIAGIFCSRLLRPFIFSLPLIPFIFSLLSTSTANRSSTEE